MPATIPKGENSAALADWVETTILNGEADAINLVRVEKLLKGEASEAAEEELREDAQEENAEDIGAEEDIDLAGFGAEAEVERDTRLDFLEAEVELRAELGAKLYPFRVEGNRIVKVNACGENVYLFLLALSSSAASYRQELRTHEAEAAFDRVALAAMRRYLGRNADGVRFARNSSDPDDERSRPKRFSDAIEWLRDLLDVRSGTERPEDGDLETSHWEWKGENPLPVRNTYNDGGVDLVVWWKFGDRRRGFPVLLVQCTVQLDWQDKLENIPLDLWRSWINFSMVPPQRALVIPFSEDPKNRLWEDRSKRAGIVVDRVRLLELLNELECEELSALVNDATDDWVRKELATA